MTKLRILKRSALIFLIALLASQPLLGQQKNSAYDWLNDITITLARARELVLRGSLAEAQNQVVRVYLDRYEPLESYYGSGGAYRNQELAAQVGLGESEFHALMRSPSAAAFTAGTIKLESHIARIKSLLAASGLPAAPEPQRSTVQAAALVSDADVASNEIKLILRELSDAAAAYGDGNAARAQTLVEHAYLEGFEPLESRLPTELVDAIEKRIHLELRPAIDQRANPTVVSGLIVALSVDLSRADRFLSRDGAGGFAAFNSFIIIVREGLEAVLLVAALLTYLAAIGAQKKHRRQIYTGVAAGVVASALTWLLARSLIPISGANRELIEGATALLAVAVLLYVAHWLFQKTYIHDWKDYLRSHVGDAVSRGSSIALAALAFAAVYREGFETVLFYQALAFDAGPQAVLSGFLPGLLLIVLLGIGIIKAGLKLPLKKVFAGTNTILLYLAFVFMGKGLYNLQEAGIFAPHPVPAPDHPALRQLLGFYPMVETIGAQAALLLLLCATYVWYRLRSNARAPRSAQLPEPRGAARRAWPGSHRSPPAGPSADLPQERARSAR